MVSNPRANHRPQGRGAPAVGWKLRPVDHAEAQPALGRGADWRARGEVDPSVLQGGHVAGLPPGGEDAEQQLQRSVCRKCPWFFFFYRR